MKVLKNLLIFISILIFLFIAYNLCGMFFETKAYNYLQKYFSASTSGTKNIAIIIIDDKSLEKIRWPWKRTEYGKIFEYFKTYGNEKVIIFDSLVMGRDKDNLASDMQFFNQVKAIDNLIVGFSPNFKDYANKIEGENFDKEFKNKFYVNIEDRRTQRSKSMFKSLSQYPREYFEAIKMNGSVFITKDFDGYLRTMPQIISYKDTLYPSLGLRAYAYLNNVDKFILTDKYITANNTDLKIPITKNNGIGIFNNIKYYKLLPQSDCSHKAYSAIDIITSLELLKRGEKPIISPSEFDGKVVILGANAKTLTFALEDALPTPIHLKHPGVDIQATNLDNILNNTYFTVSSYWVDFVTVLILMLASFLVIKYSTLLISISFNGILMILSIIFSILCYKFNHAVNLVTPLLFQIITMAVGYSYRFIIEGKNKEKIQKAMGKYISEDVMQDVVKNIDDIKLGGKKATITVLFADIRGFTSMSEKMTAQEVSEILNEYFTEIEPIITKHKGVINKFIGDAVFAIFGEPVQDKNHAINAVKCGYEMLKKVEELQKKWLLEGRPKIEIGIGINTGEAFVGNIGSEKRLEYTAIGDTVNLASRIESYNKVYKTFFLISSSTYANAREIVDAIKISDVSIRGKSKKLDLYEILRVID